MQCQISKSGIAAVLGIQFSTQQIENVDVCLLSLSHTINAPLVKSWITSILSSKFRVVYYLQDWGSSMQLSKDQSHRLPYMR